MEVGIEEQRALYQKRIPIFTRSVKGKFRTFKWVVLAVAYGVFFGLPWLPWTRHGVPGQAESHGAVVGEHGFGHLGGGQLGGGCFPGTGLRQHRRGPRIDAGHRP